MEYRKAAMEAIKRKIKVLNLIVLLIVVVMAFLTVRLLYDFLSYVPLYSMVTMLGVVAVLSSASLFISKVATADLIRTVEDYDSKLSGVLASTKKIQEEVHTDVLLNSVMESALEITGADAGSVLLADGDSLAFKIVKGREADKLTGFAFPKAQGVAGWVYTNGAPAMVSDAAGDTRFHSRVDDVTGYETRSILCVPLRLRKSVIGVLELVNKKNGAFTREDEEVLSHLADQAALSIDRARAYEDEKNFGIHLTNILMRINDNLVPEKKGHPRRVARITLQMADAMGVSEEGKRKLYNASLLHDIGFLEIGQWDIMRVEDYRAHSRVGYEILKVLTVEDYKVHSQAGYDILRPINAYADIAAIVLHHHERWDGKGYPAGLKGEAIPLESRMIFIAEAFDSMVSRFSYKAVGKAVADSPSRGIVGFREAAEEIKANAGTQFDPALVDVFLKTVTEDVLMED